MFKNYLKVAWVGLMKNKSFSFINIFGLALGMSLCLLIITILNDQYSFDKFHPDRGRIFRINTEAIRKSGGAEGYASSPYAMGQYVKEHYPYVEHIACLVRGLNGDAGTGEKTLPIEGFLTSPGFFNVFGFDLLEGDKTSALKEPYSIILTRQKAKSFFGTQEALGKTLDMGRLGVYKVTGILADPPGKTHLQFDALASESTVPALARTGNMGFDPNDWRDYYMNYTYVKLRQSSLKNELETQLEKVAGEQYAQLSLESRDKGYRFYLQPLGAITPGPMLSNNMGGGLPRELLWFLSGLAIVVIVSAGFNYNSLSLARSLGRSREIGIRKASGAMRKQLIVQFLAESVLTSLLALVIAMLIYRLVLKPGFRQLNLINRMDISLNDTLPVLGLFLVFAILVGLASGIFPALHLSRLNPVKALRDDSSRGLMPKLGFRRILLVIQFSAALIFVVTLANLFRQTNYLLHADYGFRPENIVNVDLQGNNYATLRQEMKRYNSVVEVAGISHPMGTWRDRKVDVRIKENDEPQGIRDFSIDAHYLKMVGLKPIAGKDFTEDLPAGRELVAIVNEEFLRHFHLGSPKQAIGKSILVSDSTRLSICGVLADFHFKPFVYNNEPLLLRYNPDDISILNVKIAEKDKVNTLAQMENTWKKADKIHAFSYAFYTDQMKDCYAEIRDIGRIIATVALMAVTVACLGLLGLVLFVLRRQVKEIGIRKVLGASVSQITAYLSRNFVKLLLVATVVGLPLSILLNQALLSQFAFRINPLAGYIIGFLLLTGIALVTIGIKIIAAASANPVKALRSE